MAKFQIFTYMYRPIMEDALALPFEELGEIDVHQSLDKKQEILKSATIIQYTIKGRFMSR